MGTIMFFYNHAYDVNIHLSTIMIALLVKHFLYKYFNCTIAMSAVTLHKISYHQNDNYIDMYCHNFINNTI